MFCDLEKAWLSQHGVEFNSRDITEDPAALDELMALGAYSTPVTLVNGQMVIGFDREKLSKLLDI